ncbi:hypothetical protein MSG28_008822 [Choristoneura fumiferana]|uniref:Uncharacterized protein n=2 Tax=Choristoneura fumiferana TaxID=7141 RepID=A0ACC0J845_CHOFU|nr:hypothetical protein MSG28_008822 [Choristoneura fumiferana]
MMAISNQIPFLTSVINTRERRLSMVAPRTRTLSTSSLQDPKPPPDPKGAVPVKAQVAQEIKQSVRKESPSSVPEIAPSVVAVPPPPPPREDSSSSCVLM